MDEVVKIIDELLPVGTRGTRKDGFGMTDMGGGVAWTRFNYDRIAFTFISPFRLDKIPDRSLGEYFDFDVGEESLAEARRKEAMRPDSELMRERTAKPKVLEIRWANRKCVKP